MVGVVAYSDATSHCEVFRVEQYNALACPVAYQQKFAVGCHYNIVGSATNGAGTNRFAGFRIYAQYKSFIDIERHQ